MLLPFKLKWRISKILFLCENENYAYNISDHLEQLILEYSKEVFLELTPPLFWESASPYSCIFDCSFKVCWLSWKTCWHFWIGFSLLSNLKKVTKNLIQKILNENYNLWFFFNRKNVFVHIRFRTWRIICENFFSHYWSEWWRGRGVAYPSLEQGR